MLQKECGRSKRFDLDQRFKSRDTVAADHLETLLDWHLTILLSVMSYAEVKANISIIIIFVGATFVHMN